MITILNLDKIIYQEFFNRRIQNITPQDHFGSPVYVFDFDGDMKMGNGSFEQQFEIYLSRTPDTKGKYSLYWMGLHGATVEYLHERHIKDFVSFIACMKVVIGKGKDFWDKHK